MNFEHDQEEYLINELAQRAGVTVRTIRYYTDQGLLPTPDTRGKYATYNRGHLLRLELIRQMKEAYLPLREIREIIQTLSDEEMRQRLKRANEHPGFQTAAHRRSEVKRIGLHRPGAWAASRAARAGE
jgi:DNA-binding transcriptional MerR regulator